MPDRWYQGYWRTDTGALRFGTPGVKWRNGEYLTATNALAQTGTVSGAVWKQGYLRRFDDLVMVVPGTPPFKWRDGEYLDNDGALVCGFADGSERWRQGMLRLSTGALVIA